MAAAVKMLIESELIQSLLSVTFSESFLVFTVTFLLHLICEQHDLMVAYTASARYCIQELDVFV